MSTKTKYSPTLDDVFTVLLAIEEEKRAEVDIRFERATQPPDTGWIQTKMGGTGEVAAGSVRRCLEQLVAEGRIIQSQNRGGYGVSPRALCWSTPEMEQWRNERLAEYEAKEADQDTRLAVVSRIFEDFGIVPKTEKTRYGRTVVLTLEDAEQVAVVLKSLQ